MSNVKYAPCEEKARIGKLGVYWLDLGCLFVTSQGEAMVHRATVDTLHYCCSLNRTSPIEIKEGTMSIRLSFSTERPVLLNVPVASPLPP